MAISISPLELKLDEKNPRFVILSKRDQEEIRKYLLANEDVSQLATEINNNGNLFLGERVVAIKEKNKFIVVEGNRRVCSLQLLLSRKLIPHLFEHKIPPASKKVLENCQIIEVDVLSDRSTALALMARRHIEGVRQWKPLAKKQFFASNYNDGKGRSIENLSMVTGIDKNEIKTDIRDYKLFSKAYEDYKKEHPKFDKEIIDINIDPFLRLFKAKFSLPDGTKISPLNFFGIEYDEQHNIINTVDNETFKKIVKIVFEKAIVTEEVNTRNSLTDIKDVLPLLDKIAKKKIIDQQPEEDEGSSSSNNENNSETTQQSEESEGSKTSTGTNSGGEAGGPKPGGPAPKSFFETLCWEGKLYPNDTDHGALLVVVDELHRCSFKSVNQKKIYENFPVATGMILRSVYEQALILHLKKINLWETYFLSLKGSLPTLRSIEKFIETNKKIAWIDKHMADSFNIIVKSVYRDFLNANIHEPGKIHVTPETLKGIANGGMLHLIQAIIDLLP